MAKAASLTSGLMVKKGQASPATVNTTDEEQLFMEKPQKSGDSNKRGYYKALTVKLDRERYGRLKNMGVKLDKKSQEIFVEALDLWITHHSEKLSTRQ